MKKFIFITLIMSALLLTGCDNKKTVEGCSDCVFSYYTYEEEKDIGDVLTNYTNDYKTLKDENGNQRQYFLGHTIDKDKKITKSYACGILNDKAFCIQGIDGLKNKDIYPNNQGIIKKVYGEDKCNSVSYQTLCKRNINSSTYTNGNVEVGKCSVKSSTICGDECKDVLKAKCSK